MQKKNLNWTEEGIISYLHTRLLFFPLAVTDFFQLGPKKKTQKKRKKKCLV